ncbi:MAG: DeoR/GlpR family DNA-binding transcription regulator [Ignavibacteriales bacterium]
MRGSERRKALLEAIKQQPIVSPASLASEFKVSPETIRRDLGRLERDGLVAKVHGGVAAIRQRGAEVPYETRAVENVAEKRAIAQEALSLVVPGDSLIIEGGTTAMEFAGLLKGRDDLLILTPSIQLATMMAASSDCRIVLVGGWLRRKDLIIYGNIASEMVRNFHVDKAFIGGAGLSYRHGLTDYFDEEVNLRKEIMKAAEQVILLVDHSKFFNTALLSVAPISSINTLITDDMAPEPELELIRKAGVEVRIARVPGRGVAASEQSS